MTLSTIHALVLRNLYLYTRTPVRLVELVFWPLVDLLVWGYLTVFLQQHAGDSFPYQISFLIGSVILWDVIFRAQQGVALYFLEDVWSRNLLNVFSAPVTNAEYLASTYAIGLIRAGATSLMLSGLAILLYSFNLFELSWSLLPFVFNLLLFGWSLGMISTALIVRWGPAAETLAWAVPFFIQPFAAVYYPVAALPEPIRWIAHVIPCSHIFEGMREGLRSGAVSWRELGMATGLNAVYLALAGMLFVGVMKKAREKGLLTKFVSQ